MHAVSAATYDSVFCEVNSAEFTGRSVDFVQLGMKFHMCLIGSPPLARLPIICPTTSKSSSTMIVWFYSPIDG